MTLQTLADQLGVSRMTVSNAFSRPDQLSPELRQRILAAAIDAGYTGPDPAARALARGTVGTIGILLTDSLADALRDDVATSLLASIAAELARTGKGLTLLTTIEHDGFVPARDIPMDGALVHSCGADLAAVDWLKRRRLPLVFIDQTPVSGYPSVNVDDEGGAAQAAQHLVDLGHRRVGIVVTLDHVDRGPIGRLNGVRQHHSAAARWKGWRRVLTSAGIDPVVVNARGKDEEAGAEAARQLLAVRSQDRPTGVLTYSDRLAAGVMRAGFDLGVGVPEQLSVVGFDDASFASRLQPSLTTVTQDVVEKGRQATVMLLRSVADPSARGARRVVLPTHLTVRASTAMVNPTR